MKPSSPALGTECEVQLIRAIPIRCEVQFCAIIPDQLLYSALVVCKDSYLRYGYWSTLLDERKTPETSMPNGPMVSAIRESTAQAASSQRELSLISIMNTEYWVQGCCTIMTERKRPSFIHSSLVLGKK